MSIIGIFPYNFINGTTADANQVDANFTFAQSQVNTNALALTGGALTGAITSTSSANFAGQLIGAGTVAGDNAAAGDIGEYEFVTVPAAGTVSLTTNTPANVVTLPLSAGDWDVSGVWGVVPSGGATPTLISAAISTVSGSQPTPPSGGFVQLASTFATNTGQLGATGTVRVSSTTTANVYLVMSIAFPTGAVGGYGMLRARRMR